MFQWNVGAVENLGRGVAVNPRAVAVALAAGATAGVAGALWPAGALAAAAAALAALLLLQSPRALLLAAIGVIALAPFAVVPLRIGAQLTLLDLLLTSLLLVWVARLLSRSIPLVASPLDLPVMAFLGLALASFILGLTYSMSAELVRAFLKLTNSILLFFSVTNTLRTRQDLDWALRALGAFGLAAAILAIGLYLLPQDLAMDLLSTLRVVGYPSGPEVLRFIPGTNTLRATGTSLDPNVLGGLLAVVAAVAMAQLLSARPLFPRPVTAVGLSVVAIALVLSYSRGAWIGATVALLFVGTFRYRRAWLVVGLVGILLALTPLGDVVLPRVASVVSGSDQSMAMRLGEYHDAWELIQRYPWLGVGFGDAPVVNLYVGVSSMFLLMAEQMGLVGVAAFLVVVAVALLCSSRSHRVAQDARLKGIVVGLQAALVAALIIGLFDHYFFNLRFPHTVALFWLLLGMLMVASHAPNEPETPGLGLGGANG